MILVEPSWATPASRSGRPGSPPRPSTRSRSTIGRPEEPLPQEDHRRRRDRGLARPRHVHAATATCCSGTTRARRAVVARISLRDVMVIHLDGLGGAGARARDAHLRRARPCARQPALAGAGQGTARVYVPLTVDRKVMASVMKTHRFEGIRYEFVPGGEDRSLSRAARVAAPVRRRRGPGAHAYAGPLRRGRTTETDARHGHPPTALRPAK